MGLLRSTSVGVLRALLADSRPGGTPGERANAGLLAPGPGRLAAHLYPLAVGPYGLAGGALTLAGIVLGFLPLLSVLRRRRTDRVSTALVVVTEPGQHQVRFALVGGAATAKAALLRLGAPLRIDSSGSTGEHERSRSGRRKTVPSVGAVLHGPPGCGKTLLAHALAGELNLPLYTISGVALGELRAGAGAAQVQELFATAMRRAPCVVFIDDLDALASPRADATPADREARAHTVHKLVSALDTLVRRTAKVVVLAAQGRPGPLDPALVRPTRLGRSIALGLPDERERADIIALLACAHPELRGLDAQALAARTASATGADLRALLARTAQHVAERHRADPTSPDSVAPADLDRALTERSPPRAPE